ncbi:stereocilin-like [Acropora millepora]|uniref:stereocilin-like n=1 Tax=Acropora millepora TaxID=45264 RepID=UPI001CF2F104|nr:stereocilin-like [Acropora millepora]XP_044184179.1 stereocilin-like [Acropora millepora]
MKFLRLFTPCLSVIVLVLLSPTGVGGKINCCTQLSIPSECHFLCGIGSQSFWSVTRWKCTHKYFAKVATCDVNNKINYVKLFGQELTQTVKNGFDKLTESLKAKLSNAKEFVKATVQELLSVPQDVLSSLKESLGGMTRTQFRGIIDRLTAFTSQNLKKLVAYMNLDSFFANVDKVVTKAWDREQMAAFSQAAYRKFGSSVRQWPVTALQSMKQLLASLDASELAQLTGDIFDKGVSFICMAKFDRDQKAALMIPAKAAYGDVTLWNATVLGGLCNVLEALPVRDILSLTANVVTNAIDAFVKQDFSVPQGKAIVAKLKEEWKDVKSWGIPQLKKLGKLLKDFSVADLKSLTREQFQAIEVILTQLELNPGQVQVLVAKAKELLASPDQWNRDNLRELGHLVAGLLPSDLRKIDDQVIKDSLQFLKNVDLNLDQAQEIVDKLKKSFDLSQLKTQDIVALAKSIDGFLSSDIGKLAQFAVFSAFPEMKIVKVAMPVLRKFIKRYEEDPTVGKSIAQLGQFAVALSRGELEGENVDKIILNLDKLGLIPWDKTQILTLAKKIRQSWGHFNGTDSDDSDNPNWGFLNLKKLGHIAVGIAKEELRDLPIRGIENAIDALGQQKDWDRGQIVRVLTRLREYWEMENLDFSNFTEGDINSLGTFLRGLAQEELKKLPEAILMIAIRRLGEQTGLPEDKLKARAFLAVELFKNQTGIDVLNSSHIEDLGSLVAGLSRTALRKISKEAFLDNLYNIARAKGYDEKKLKEIAKLAKQHLEKRDVADWIGDHWRNLGPAALGLDPSDLERINADALEEMLNDFGTFSFSKSQAQALIKAAKKAWGEYDVGKWTGERLRQLGSLVKGLEIDEIKKLGREAFEEAVGVWGQYADVDMATLEALAGKAKQFLTHGDTSKLTAQVAKRIGRVLLGLNPDDLDKLKLDNIDIIAALGKLKGWRKDQLDRLKPKVQEFLKTLNKDDDAYMSLGQLALSLTKEDINRISQNAFRLAVKQLSEVDGWSEEQKKAIINRAKVVWSQQVDQWDKDQVNELGPVLEAMSTTDIPKLRPEVVDVIPPKVFEDMSLPQLQAFSADQYNAMLTPQVQAISRAKRDSLTMNQQDAIRSVIASDPDEEDPWGPDDDDYCQGHTCSASSYVTVSYLVLLLVGPVGVLLR